MNYQLGSCISEKEQCRTWQEISIEQYNRIIWDPSFGGSEILLGTLQEVLHKEGVPGQWNLRIKVK